MFEPSTLLSALAVSCSALYLLQWLRTVKYNAVPAVGPSMPLLSFFGAARFLYDAKAVITEGYDKYGSKPFRVANFRQWLYIVSTPKHIDELKQAPDAVLSFNEAVFDDFSFHYTLGMQDERNAYHVPVVQTTLTRNIAVLSDDVYDEIKAAFAEVIPETTGWVAVPAFDSMTQIVARISNRIFVGLPLCRNSEFLDVSIKYTGNVAVTGLLLGIFPNFLRPVVNPMINTVTGLVDTAERLLTPLIKERRKCMSEYGDDWSEKPNDMLQWLIEAANKENPGEQTYRALSTRILLMEFAALHTSSMSFTFALYHLAANPEYILPLREEVEAILATEGWSKNTLQKMCKIDSFLKESQRLTGLSDLLITHKALQDFTFSDGTFVPKGNYICTTTPATHHNDKYYSNAHEFNPWRFSDMRNKAGEGMKHQMISVSPEYLPFGLGRHACPGRFFAANELKSMLAHTVMTYDVALQNPREVPKSEAFGTFVAPNRTAKVLFRKRRD